MTERLSIEATIKGLSTTSDRIRALAKAGYLRTEISKALDIRYQHVRKVLMDAGIKGGLVRAVELERSDDVVEVIPEHKEPVSSAALINAGFISLGEWKIVDGKIKLEKRAPHGAGVYAFVLDDAVVYVGVTHNGLQTRMDQYRYGHEKQKTNARINGLISSALANGSKVETLVAEPTASDWNGLPVDGAAGLEVGLIEIIQPVWNMRGIK
jgi:hypothetical protein